MFNHPWQVSFSAPPGPDTPERKPESQDPGSRQEQHELWVSARVKRDEGATQSHLRGQLGQQPASVVLSPPAPQPLTERPSPAAEPGRPTPLTQGRAELPATVLAQQELAASAGAPPARSAPTPPPARRLEAGRARLPPERSRHCPVRRHSLGTTANCRLHPGFKRAQRAEPGMRVQPARRASHGTDSPLPYRSPEGGLVPLCAPADGTKAPCHSPPRRPITLQGQQRCVTGRGKSGGGAVDRVQGQFVLGPPVRLVLLTCFPRTAQRQLLSHPFHSYGNRGSEKPEDLP